MAKSRSVIRSVLCVLILASASWGFSSNTSSKKPKEEHKTVPEFSFWTVGSGFSQRFGESAHEKLAVLQQDKHEFCCLLQAIAVEAQKEQEILKKCRISSSWLSRAVNILIPLNFLGNTDGSEYYSKVPVMTDAEMKRVQESLQPIVTGVAEKISRHVPDIKQAYDENKQVSDPNWEYISHLVIDKYLIDGFFHHRLETLEGEKGIKKYYSSEQKKVPAFFLERGSKYGTFGVNWYGFKDGSTERNVYILHGAPFGRYNIPFNKYGWKKDFSDIFLRIRSNGCLEGLSRDEVQIFEDLGWVANQKLAIPFVQTGSLKVFKEELEKIGNEAAEIVIDDFSVIMTSFRNSPHSKYSEGAGDYIQVCYHLMFSSIIKELIEMKVIPPVPKSIPEYFGVFITTGSNFFDD